MRRVSDDGWSTPSSTLWMKQLQANLELLRGLDAGGRVLGAPGAGQ